MSEARKKELMDKYHLPEDVANKLSVYSAPRGIYNNKKTETPPITHVKETLSVENQETQLVATSEEQPSILNLI